MQLGVIFPQTEIGAGRAGVRDFAQAADELGFDYLVAYDHVLGADPAHYPRLYDAPVAPSYSYETLFHEVFVLFGYLAGITERIQLVTGVLIVPQRQTALVAKQAAEVDILSDGRLILGVGTGWNSVEYDALGQDFRARGRRQEEQIGLLRRLWSERVVDFEGEFDRVEAAGLFPLPERPIPIWLGGAADVVLDRIGRIGDGWLLGQTSRAVLRSGREKILEAAREAGRDPSEIAFGVGVRAEGPRGTGFSPEQQAERALEFESLGATHCSIVTMDAGFTSLDQHIDAIRRFREAMQAATPAS